MNKGNPEEENRRLAAELAAVRQSLDAAHDWLTEAVGDYCKPTADEPIGTVADQLRLRCESATKRLTEVTAALAKSVKRCGECGGTGIEHVAGKGKVCPWCKSARELLTKLGVKL